MKWIRFTLFIFLFALLVSSGVKAEDVLNSEPVPNFRIDGIAYDSQDPSKSIGMINGIALHKGDEYRGYKVAEIDAGHVMMVNAETGTPYELTPGDGQTNIQKREGWNPLKDLKLPDIPDAKKKPPGARPGGAAKPKTEEDKASEELMRKLNPFGTLLESKDKVEKQIDEIKAVQNERINLLNNIMDGMEPQAQASPKK